ncbi:MAG: hypothetical protein AB7G36_05425 [Candidatus Nanopelagicales bacterium]
MLRPEPMPRGHPERLPDLFLDRSLGGKQVPARLREEGLRLQTLAEVYGRPQDEEVLDVEWLELAGRNGWVVLMKDDRIRYRRTEREALVTHNVRAFCLSGGNLRAADMADQFLNVLDRMAAACAEPPPCLYVVSASGMRKVQLEA